MTATTTETTLKVKSKVDESTSLLQQIRTKLITHEDVGHIHKTLGIAVLAMYLVRSWWLLDPQRQASGDMMFDSHPQHTLWTVCLHLSLNLTSFVFAIPARRIREGSRIWPEFRWHTLIFLCRNLFLITVYHWEKHVTPDAPPNFWFNYAAVILTMAAVDTVSWCYGKQEKASPSIRELAGPKVVKYVFSLAQFVITAHCLVGVRRCTPMYMNAWVVQLNPFFMTLRRKNLVSHAGAMVLYGGLIAWAHVVVFYDMTVSRTHCVNGIIGFAAYLWRTNPLGIYNNKYVIWTVMAIVMEQTNGRDQTGDGIHSFSKEWIYVTIVLSVLLIANGYYKCFVKPSYGEIKSKKVS